MESVLSCFIDKARVVAPEHVSLMVAVNRDASIFGRVFVHASRPNW